MSREHRQNLNTRTHTRAPPHLTSPHLQVWAAVLIALGVLCFCGICAFLFWQSSKKTAAPSDVAQNNKKMELDHSDDDTLNKTQEPLLNTEMGTRYDSDGADQFRPQVFEDLPESPAGVTETVADDGSRYNPDDAVFSYQVRPSEPYGTQSAMLRTGDGLALAPAESQHSVPTFSRVQPAGTYGGSQFPTAHGRGNPLFMQETVHSPDVLSDGGVHHDPLLPSGTAVGRPLALAPGSQQNAASPQSPTSSAYYI